MRDPVDEMNVMPANAGIHDKWILALAGALALLD
jgi:hypothetical protein